jgi:photosystem II stability/assembly factor-like uncharacterized protein
MHRGRRLALAALAAAAPLVEAQAWRPVGPLGGDVRTLAASPANPAIVYLGTADGVLFRTDDSGESWRRLEPGFPLRGRSLDSLVVTPAGDVLVGYWEVSGSGGGVARSRDGGRSFEIFEGIAGRSVRAIAFAPSDPARLVAGALDGVFASADAGASWSRLTPDAHEGLRMFESVAIDPVDASVIYAGTWRLPWKTSDGGRSWSRISNGMVFDSDVFSLTLDARGASTVYATACTGVYRSNDAGRAWTKLRGIPASSRRTRAFAQDPARPERLFAGTTEGLWVSEDGGRSWEPRTARDVVVNALAALPGGRVLIGTDGAGVLKSLDGGRSFAPSNAGFSARYVARVLRDPAQARYLAALGHDRVHGGVVQAAGPKGPWRALAGGLEGREVTSLAAAGADVLAGTDDGIFVLTRGAGRWQRLRTTTGSIDLQPRVAELLVLPDGAWLAATDKGLLQSGDRGRTWAIERLGSVRTVSALALRPNGDVLAATPVGLYESRDGGLSFALFSTGPTDARVTQLLFVPGRNDLALAATAIGLFRSTDWGQTWARVFAFPATDVEALAADPDGRFVWASDFARGGLFRSADGGVSWSSFATEGLVPDRVWRLLVEPGERLLAATASGGLHLFEPTPVSAPATR